VGTALLAGLTLVFLRFGVHWLAVVAAGGWAVLRRLLPFAWRLFPFASRAWSQSRKRARGRDGSADRNEDGPMTRAQALKVLGLEEGASQDEVIAAYKHLIAKVHPDAPGGSTYLAAQVNQAKDLLTR
jgi:hypothetical protein